MKKSLLGLTFISALLSGAHSYAAQSSHDHTSMAGHGSGHGQHRALPKEAGQGAFAALSEIVDILLNNPNTDWDKVDIDGLQKHLLQMNQLVLEARVTSRQIPDGLEMSVSKLGPASEAVKTMVPAHAPVLTNETSWNSDVKDTGNHMIWTVTSKDDAAKIRALGFFGLMAMGHHHQGHHLNLATGNNPHH